VAIISDLCCRFCVTYEILDGALKAPQQSAVSFEMDGKKIKFY